jgi:hypothetical protein
MHAGKSSARCLAHQIKTNTCAAQNMPDKNNNNNNNNNNDNDNNKNKNKNNNNDKNKNKNNTKKTCRWVSAADSTRHVPWFDLLWQ